MLTDFFDKHNPEYHDMAKRLTVCFADGKLVHISHWKAFIDALIGLMKYGNDDRSRKIFLNWEMPLKAMRDVIEQADVDKAAITRHGSTLGRLQTKFPLMAAFVVDPDELISQQYRSLCMVVLLAVILNGNTKGFKNFLISLRMTSDRRSPLYGILLEVPLYEDDLTSYRSALITSIDLLQKTLDDNVYPRIHPLLKKIKLIAQIISEHSSEYGISIDYPVQPGVIDWVGIKGIRPGVTVTPSDDENDEPDVISFIQEDDDDPEDAVFQPYEAVASEARVSRYWLRRHNKLSIHDRACLTSIEKQVVNNFINEQLVSPENSSFVTALVIATSYVWPLTLDQVIALFNDPHQNMIAEDGSLTCHVYQLPDGYRSSNRHAEGYADVIKSVQLTPPALLTTALKSVNTAGGRSILTHLHTTRVATASAIESQLEKLRHHGEFRINQARINNALIAEITCLERNVLLTHYIDGAKKDAPPVLAYYGAMREEMITEIYSEAAEKLLWAA